jgi:superfamily II DNA or RNA helicase
LSKNVISKWKTVLNQFEVKYVTVVNYELLIRGKYYINNIKLNAPFLSIQKNRYIYNVDDDVIFIFDEAHKCKYINTSNAKLLIGAKETNNKILLLSATLIENIKQFAIFGYVLGLSHSYNTLVKWIQKLQTPAKTIHYILFEDKKPKAARLTIEELGDQFPETQVTADTYTMKDSNNIVKEYEKIVEKIKEFKENGTKSQLIIAKLQTEFRNIELLKIPTFIDLTEEYLENNYSVVIFVNYTETINILYSKLKQKSTVSLIHGGQTEKERNLSIDNFQNNKAKILIANIKAGGVGISLHDLDGKHPRISLISPTQSATNLVQVLGRIHRSGGKSKSLQRIIFAANTPEADISKMLYRKLANLSLLNDGDMETYYIDGLIKDDKLIKKIMSDNDLKIIIDKEFEHLKNKKIMHCDNIIEIFEKNINTISGSSSMFIVKGINNTIFNDKNILLLGEHHDSNVECKKCNETCIEVSNIVAYLIYSLYPKYVDFYCEIAYYPGEKKQKNKFERESYTDSISRINILHNKYSHLLRSSKNKNFTERLRLHASDTREIYIKNNNEISGAILIYTTLWKLWKFIVHFEYIMTDKNNNINYIHKKLEEYEKIINNPENKTIILEIITGANTELNNIFKITKQLENIKNNVDEKFLIAINDSIAKHYYNTTEKILDIIFSITDIIKYYINKYADDKYKCVNKIYNKILNQKYMENNFTEFHNLSNIFASYMDIYTIYRMLRKFNDENQNNIIFYGGDKHARNIYKIFIKTGYFTSVASKINEHYDDCIKL